MSTTTLGNTTSPAYLRRKALLKKAMAERIESGIPMGPIARREPEVEVIPPVNKGTRILKCSYHEIIRLQQQALKDGTAFCAQKIGACLYRVMEIK